MHGQEDRPVLQVCPHSDLWVWERKFMMAPVHEKTTESIPLSLLQCIKVIGNDYRYFHK